MDAEGQMVTRRDKVREKKKSADLLNDGWAIYPSSILLICNLCCSFTLSGFTVFDITLSYTQDVYFTKA